jgi:Family of unknown function (DUF6152)
MRLRSLFLLCLSPTVALAHHSRAEFSGEVQELNGELVDVVWTNPHPTFKVRTSGDSSEVWDIQLFGSVTTLTRTGVPSELFEIGQPIRIAGIPSDRRPHMLLGTHALLRDGTETILDYRAGPRWSHRYVGGKGGDVYDESVLSRAAAEHKGIFRVWSIPTYADAVGAVRAMRPAFTDAAIAARKNWDLLDNPITRCEFTWMPHVMYQPGLREVVDNGDTITVKSAYGNSRRTIHMRPPDELRALPRTPMGYSVGHWEGNTLVVETTNIAAPAFDADGSLQSDSMVVTERYTVSEDQSRLDYELVMTDPIAFKVPAVFRTYYLALGEPFRAAGCERESQTTTTDARVEGVGREARELKFFAWMAGLMLLGVLVGFPPSFY